jgi:mannose-1-phosphate guanylyltransferase
MSHFPKKEKFFQVSIMQADFALILCAGFGTRMGELGKVLPKVIWPIFSKTLLELQLDYCRDLGINNIYINVHFQHEEIIKHLSTISHHNLNITVLYENPLLDSGGAIHNLARRQEIGYSGKLLLLNGDQFLFFNIETYQRALESLKNPEIRAILFGIIVNKNENYNETIIKDDLLINIEKSTNGPRSIDFVTYSGFGIVKLDGLQPIEGASKFFQSVVNYKFEKTIMVVPEKSEYWDFGTSEIYVRNIFKILAKISKNEGCFFKSFLEAHAVDFSNYKNFLNEQLNSIDLCQGGDFEIDRMKFNNISQKI